MGKRWGKGVSIGLSILVLAGCQAGSTEGRVDLAAFESRIRQKTKDLGSDGFYWTQVTATIHPIGADVSFGTGTFLSSEWDVTAKGSWADGWELSLLPHGEKDIPGAMLADAALPYVLSLDWLNAYRAWDGKAVDIDYSLALDAYRLTATVTGEGQEAVGTVRYVWNSDLLLIEYETAMRAFPKDPVGGMAIAYRWQ